MASPPSAKLQSPWSAVIRILCSAARQCGNARPLAVLPGTPNLGSVSSLQSMILQIGTRELRLVLGDVLTHAYRLRDFLNPELVDQLRSGIDRVRRSKLVVGKAADRVVGGRDRALDGVGVGP